MFSSLSSLARAAFSSYLAFILLVPPTQHKYQNFYDVMNYANKSIPKVEETSLFIAPFVS